MLGRTTLSATSLYECLVELNGEKLPQSTLLPVFDVDGRVHFVALLDTSSDVRVFNPGEVRVRIGNRDIVRIEAASGVHVFGSDHAGRSEDLWHYDPWWLLKLDRYRRFQYATAVKASNCARLESPAIAEVFYRRDLTWVLKAAKSYHGSQRIVRFRSLRMPPRQQSRQ